MTEEQLQIAAIKYLRSLDLNLLAFHPPNGGYRTKAEGARLKRHGVLAGVSDILVLNHPGLAIELKTSSGVLSAKQGDFGAAVSALGWTFRVCRSLAEVEAAVFDAYGER